MITTAKEAIQLLQKQYKENLEEDLLITWWDSSDFNGLDLDQAFSNGEDSLDVCVGHVNDYVQSETPKLKRKGK